MRLNITRRPVPSLAAVAAFGMMTLWTGASTLGAHHSFAATYFEDRTIEITGTLLSFQFRNPHSFVHIQAPDDDGEMQRWAVEWGGAGQLGQQGVTSTTLRAGDEVTIVGNPGRVASDHRVRMISLQRLSDGYGWGQAPDETFN